MTDGLYEGIKFISKKDAELAKRNDKEGHSAVLTKADFEVRLGVVA